MNFQNIFTNSWFVSLVTGLVVFLVTEIIKRLRERKFYNQQVRLANKEILQTLKMIIPEDTFPQKEILYTLHSSTAQKYKVKISDMDPLELILGDLIKEIMDSSFLSYNDKLDYSDSLVDIKVQIEREAIMHEIEIDKIISGSHEKDSFTGKTTAFLFATTASVVSLIVTFLANEEKANSFEELSKEISVYSFVMSLILSLLIINIAFIRLKRLRKKDSNNEFEEEPENEKNIS